MREYFKIPDQRVGSTLESSGLKKLCVNMFCLFAWQYEVSIEKRKKLFQWQYYHTLRTIVPLKDFPGYIDNTNWSQDITSRAPDLRSWLYYEIYIGSRDLQFATKGWKIWKYSDCKPHQFIIDENEHIIASHSKFEGIMPFQDSQHCAFRFTSTTYHYCITLFISLYHFNNLGQPICIYQQNQHTWNGNEN